MKPLYKILIIVGLVVLTGLGIYLVWNRFIAPPTAPTAEENLSLPTTPGVSTQTSENQEAAVNAATGQKTTLKKLSDGPVFDFWTVSDTKEVYYLNPDGKVFAAKDGPDLEISNQTLNALNSIEIGPADKKILAAFGDPQAPDWGIFDLLDKAWRPLPTNVLNAAWGQDENKLIALVKNNNYLNLNEVDLTKTPLGFKTLIKDFRLKDVKITSLPNQKIIFIEKPAASYKSRVWQFDPKNLTLNLLESPASGLILKWSKDKSLAFQFSAPNNFLVLTGDLKSGLSSVWETLPSKCASASSTLFYCFEPKNLPANLTLPDDYLQKNFYSIDNLFKMDLMGDKNDLVFESASADFPALDAKNPQIMEDKIYFINRYDNFLYELKLSN